MSKNCCPWLGIRTFVSDKIGQRCTTDDTYLPKLQCICHSGNSAGLSPNSMTEHKTGVFRIGITCLFSSSGSFLDAVLSESSQTLPPPTQKGAINLASAILPLSGTLFPRPTCSVPSDIRGVRDLYGLFRTATEAY